MIDERYWTPTDTGHETLCWIWKGTKTAPYSYGQTHLRGVRMTAHRAVWLERVGPWPEGKQADHLCKVKSCVNPDHIEPVTASVNMRRSPRAKITEEQLPLLFQMYEEGASVRALARHFGATRDSIKRNLKIGSRYGSGPIPHSRQAQL
jgi:hypothetical protein